MLITSRSRLTPVFAGTILDLLFGVLALQAQAATGTAAAASLSSTSLTFGSQVVGTSSAAQSVVVTNMGAASFNFSNIATAGDFAIDASGTTCSTTSPLAAGASCAIAVTFTPTVTGSESGTLTVTDDAGTQQVGLSGTGTSAGVTLTPSSLTFGSQVVGTTSTTLSAVLTNTGTSDLTISGVVVTSDFTQTNTCGGGTIASNSGCTISVAFTPTAAGTQTGEVLITDDASGGQQTLALTGSGTAPGLTLAPSSLSFGNTVVGASPEQTVTLTNTATSTLAISAIAASGAFSETNTCGTSLLAGAVCTISVTFAPSTTGVLTRTIMITDNAAGSPHTVGLMGTGVPAVGFTLAPAQGSSATRTVTAGQTATWTLAVTPTGGYTGSVSLICGTPGEVIANQLPPGTTCTPTPPDLNITGTAPVTATIIVTTTALALAPRAPRSSPRLLPSFRPHLNPPWLALCLMSFVIFTLLGIKVSRFRQPCWLAAMGMTVLVLGWTACGGGATPISGPTPAPSVTLSPGSLMFGSQNMGTTSAPQTVTLTNTGSAILTIQGITPTTSDFNETSTCGSSVAAGANCSINIKFSPTSTGTLTAALNVNDEYASGPPGTQTVSLTGAAVPPATTAGTYLILASAFNAQETQTIQLTLIVK